MGDRVLRVFEEGVGTSPGIVHQLIRDGDEPRDQTGGYAAHSGHGDDMGGADGLQRPEIGAVVDAVGGLCVAATVAGQEHHGMSAVAAFHQRGRWRAVGGLGQILSRYLQTLQGLQAGSADDGDAHVSLIA